MKAYAALAAGALFIGAALSAQAQNCKVLLVGGDTDAFVSTNPAATAELYNPQTQTFAKTAGAPHLGPGLVTATRLPNGRVLVTGGGVAELYRPYHDDFIPTGTPLESTDDTAIALLDGRILLLSAVNPSTTGEVYNWRTGKFHLVKSGISGVGAVLDNGQVLLGSGSEIDVYRPRHNDVISVATIPSTTIGGFAQTGTATAIAPIAGNKALIVENLSDFYLQSQVYDRDTNVLGSAEQPQGGQQDEPTSLLTITKLQTGAILILGGDNSGIGNAPINELAMIYQPSDDVLQNIPQANVPCKVLCAPRFGSIVCDPTDCADGRVFDSATLLPNGQVLVAGGETQEPDLSISATVAPTSGWLYNQNTNSFTATAGNMTTPRVGLGAALVCK